MVRRLELDNIGLPKSMNTAHAAGTMPELIGKMEGQIREEMGTAAALDVSVLKDYLENPAIARLVEGGITEYMNDVALGTLALAFAGKDLHLDDVQKMLDAAGVKSDSKFKFFFSLTHLIRYSNHRVYIYAVYFLSFLGKEPTVDDVVNTAKALGAVPDATAAKRIADFCKRYAATKEPSMDVEMQLKEGVDRDTFIKFRKVISELSYTMADFFINEINLKLKNTDILERFGNEALPYIWAVSSLCFAGMDIYRENIGELLLAVGVKPRDDLMDAIMELRFRNKLIYVISLNYLVFIGVEPTVESTIDVSKAMGATPDAVVAQQALDYYNSRKLNQNKN